MRARLVMDKEFRVGEVDLLADHLEGFLVPEELRDVDGEGVHDLIVLPGCRVQHVGVLPVAGRADPLVSKSLRRESQA